MKFTLSGHASTVVAERGIRNEWIELALSAPQKTHADDADPSLVHHLVEIAAFENRVLRVVVNVRGGAPHVVTAFFDRSMRGKLT